MKNSTISNLNAIFYFALAISFIIFLLPGKYKMAVYTPNLLGYYWLLSLPLILLAFLCLGIVDLRHGTRKRLTIRTVTFLATILFCTWFWFYRYQILSSGSSTP